MDEAMEWIPVIEKLPKEEGWYEITCQRSYFSYPDNKRSEELSVEHAFFKHKTICSRRGGYQENNCWSYFSRGSQFPTVLAWRPLPKPYPKMLEIVTS